MMGPLAYLSFIRVYHSRCNKGHGKYESICGGARCSSVVRAFAYGAIGCWIDPSSYFLFQPVFHNWCTKGCSMCYPVCVIMQ